MSRADRIVQRRAWFAAIGSWHHSRSIQRTAERDGGSAAKKESGLIRKSFRRWIAEWRVFGTHSAKKIKAIVEQQKAFAEVHAREAKQLDAEAQTPG